MRVAVAASLACMVWPAIGRADAPPDDVAAVMAVPPPPPPPTERRTRRFFVRLGGAFVAPLASSQPLQLSDIDGAASLAVKNGPIAGSGSSIDSAVVLAGIVGVVLPIAHDHFAIETVLGPPFTIKFHGTGSLANMSIAPTALGIPTGVPALGTELGEAKAAPPVLTLVYRARTIGPVMPLVGLGVSVLFALDEKITNPILTQVSQPKFSLPPAPGLVLQTGLDIKLWKNVYARLDVKFIAFMEARATVERINVATPDLPLFGSAEVGTAKLNVWVNPLIVEGGVGFDF